MADVLILDDDFELAKSWQTELKKAGHTAVIAQSSEEAILHIERRTFHTAVVDLMIGSPLGGDPDSGIHFLRALREMDVPQPTLIGVSGYYGSDDGQMARKLLKVYGVHHVLLKPLAPQDLVDLV
ncbi:MAG: response regulator [Pseudomonadota bacterium]